MKKLSLLFVGMLLAGAGCAQQPPAEPVAEKNPAPSPAQTIAVGEPNPSAPIETTKPEEPKVVAPAKTGTVNIHMVALGNGSGNQTDVIGCGDKIIPVSVQIKNMQAPLSEAIKAQVAVRDQYYGQSGLYNALYQSRLTLASAAITNGKATIKLTGTHALGGTCDVPRFEAQLERTALQFSTVKSVEIFLNGVTMKDALSSK